MKMSIRMVAEKRVDGVLMGRKGETPEPGGGVRLAHGAGWERGHRDGSLPLSRNCENFSISAGYFAILVGLLVDAGSWVSTKVAGVFFVGVVVFCM